MLAFLSQLALAADSTADAVMDVVQEGNRRTLNAAAHLGLDMSGMRPGVGARLDIGHRVGVDGTVYAGLPMAEGLKWTGGASVGLSFAPVRVQLGHKGSVDLRLGVGGRMQSISGVQVSVAGLDWSAWASGTVELSPDGRWTVYGGLLADQLESRAVLAPTGGVRLRID